ncbi:MAG: acetylglutamate kinase [Peptostreptococcales bacterium]
MQRVDVLIEALPYIKRFSGKTFVIKYGGSIMNNEAAKKAFIEDVVLLKLVGINIVIVHGGGPDISSMLKKLDIGTQFINGLRVTDEATMEVVEMVLSGKINKDLVGEFCKHGMHCMGISGRDSNLIIAKKMYTFINEEKIDIGYVGEVEKINIHVINDMISKGYVPVVSPVGADDAGNIYNINADYVAGAIASELKAEKFILLSDIEGLYRDLEDKSSFISEVTSLEIQQYIHEGIISGGMIPKMECCIDAIKNGVQDVHVISGKNEHSLLLEIFTDSGSGTMIRGVL